MLKPSKLTTELGPSVSANVSVTEKGGNREAAINELVLNGPISVGLGWVAVPAAVAEKLIRGSMVDDTEPLNVPIRLVEAVVDEEFRKATKLLVATRGAVRGRVVSRRVIVSVTVSLEVVGFVRRALPASNGLVMPENPKF